MFTTIVCISILLLCNCISSDDMILSKPLIQNPVSTTIQCTDAGQCIHSEICVAECKDGTGPLCATAACVNKKCQPIGPCSQKSECTDTDLSKCIISYLCVDCKAGYTPPCPRAVCENGQCKTIKVCSVFEGSTTKKTGICTEDNECPRPQVCAVKCYNDTTPRCASAKCVHGECVTIRPCSQQMCKTKVTCPYNKNNCATCPKGYEPTCEQAACSCGICSIVAPCSKKMNIIINALTTQPTLKIN